MTTKENDHIAVGSTITVDGPDGRTGEVRGVQMLEPPVSYLVTWPEGGNEWVSGDRVALPVVKAKAAAAKKPAGKKKAA